VFDRLFDELARQIAAEGNVARKGQIGLDGGQQPRIAEVAPRATFRIWGV